MRNNIMFIRLLRVSLLFHLALSLVCPTSLRAENWQPVNFVSTPGNIDTLALKMSAYETLLIGAHGRVYDSSNAGKSWREIAAFGQNIKINELFFNGDEIFALTSEGVWKKTGSKNWEKIFFGMNPKEKNATQMTRHPTDENVFFLGTDGGLFKSKDRAKTWYKESNELAHQMIRDLKTDFEKNEIFVASSKGLYRFVVGQNKLDRVYITKTFFETDDLNDLEEVNENTGPVVIEDQIFSILIVPSNDNEIAIATTDGIFTSDDEGNRWQRLPSAGIGNATPFNLAYSINTNTLFAATDKGVFAFSFQKNTWQELRQGLPDLDIKRIQLTVSENEKLFVLNNKGIYVLQINPIAEFSKPEIEIPAHQWGLLLELFRREPSVQTIQKKAIQYANVHHLKTKKWQWASRFRALVPSFSIGKNFSTNNNIDIDRGGTNEPDKFILGPADEDESWNFDLNWNLSDLIWSTAQTSIDSREKTMVDLRNDILSEITRLYFERRRAQTEFVLSKPVNPLEIANAELRIAELTANIDSLTNGYLSNVTSQIYENNPELKELWQ